MLQHNSGAPEAINSSQTQYIYYNICIANMQNKIFIVESGLVQIECRRICICNRALVIVLDLFNTTITC